MIPIFRWNIFCCDEGGIMSSILWLSKLKNIQQPNWPSFQQVKKITLLNNYRVSYNDIDTLPWQQTAMDSLLQRKFMFIYTFLFIAAPTLFVLWFLNRCQTWNRLFADTKYKVYHKTEIANDQHFLSTEKSAEYACFRFIMKNIDVWQSMVTESGKKFLQTT